MRHGTKRLFCLLMLFGSPLVSAAPISTMQELVRHPQLHVTFITPISKTPSVEKEAVRQIPLNFGTASWYSETDPGINRYTANGEVFDDSQRTCASWEYPFDAKLQITNLKNGKSVVCRVNDRGPHKRLNRIIDLTQATFHEISPLKKGLLRVSVKRIA